MSATHGLMTIEEVERLFAYRDNRNNTAHDDVENFARETLRLIPGLIADVTRLEAILRERHSEGALDARTTLPQSLALRPQHLAMLRDVLQQHLPQAEVWAYGSRVNGNGPDASDLDLVVRQPNDLKQQTHELGETQEAMSESNLPIRVEIVDWARIPASFQREIEQAYVVVQTGGVHA